MNFKLKIKNLSRNELLRMVVSKVNVKSLQNTTISARNRQELSSQLINELGEYRR